MLLSSPTLDTLVTRLQLSREGLFSFVGVVDGMTVRFDPSGDRTKNLVVSALRHRVSDIGLDVKPSGMILGARRFETEDPAFDGLFSRSCEPGDETLARAICDGAVRQALTALAAMGEVTLDDDRVTTVVSLPALSVDELERVVRTAVAAARAADRATKGLSASKEIAARGIDEALRSIAASNDLMALAHPATLAGTTRHGDHLDVRIFCADRRLRAWTVSSRPARGLHANVVWAEPLARSLRVRRSSAFDRAQSLVGLGDVQLGDAPFDRAWTLQMQFDGRGEASRASELLRAQLNDEVRRLLMGSIELGVELSLDDRGLVATGPFPSSSANVEALARLLIALGPALRARGSDGPYR